MALATIGTIVHSANNSFSFECAFSISTANTAMVLAGKQTNNVEWSIELDSTDSNLLRLFTNEATNGVIGYNICNSLSSAGVTADNAWHYLSFVYDHTINNMSTYIDGVEVRRNTLGATDVWVEDQESIIVLGARDKVGTNQWQGRIDEFQIYHRALGTIERLESYAYWKNGTLVPTYDPLAVALSTTSITDTVPSGLYQTPNVTANVTGGSGNVTYAWSLQATGTPVPATVPVLFIIDDFDSGTTFFYNSYSGVSVTGYVLRCTVTDTGTAEEVFDDLTLNITWESVQQSTDLIMHHTMDNITGFVSTDETGNGHDATFVRTPVTASGQVDNGIVIDSTPSIQYATVVDDVQLQPSAFTVAVHAKVDAVAGNVGTIFQVYDAELELILNPDPSEPDGIGDFTAGGHQMSIGYDNNTNDFLFRVVMGSGVLNAPVISNEVVMQAGVYQHLAYTFDGTDLKMYIDGTEVLDTPIGSFGYMLTNFVRLFNVTTTFTGTPVTSGAIADGEYDDLRYYNKALTQTEIQELVVTPSVFEVTIAPAGIVTIVNPPQFWISPIITATPTGGSGNYTYLWTRISGNRLSLSGGVDDSATVTVEGFGNGETTDVFKVVVTDTTTMNTAEDTIQVIVNWGAV